MGRTRFVLPAPDRPCGSRARSDWPFSSGRAPYRRSGIGERLQPLPHPAPKVRLYCTTSLSFVQAGGTGRACGVMERKTRFELATFCLASRRSTTELLPLGLPLRGGEGRWGRRDLNSHGLLHVILNHARLPVPTLPRGIYYTDDGGFGKFLGL